MSNGIKLLSAEYTYGDNSAYRAHFENLDLKCSKINGPPNFSLFDTFLDVEQEFIPKKFQKLCPFKGRPIQPRQKGWIGQPWLARPSKGHNF